MKREVSYRVYVPGGNNTAFVLGTNYSLDERIKINNKIMESDSSIEQVGFLGDNKDSPELVMAGGEFCGNATRSAVYYYLNGKDGNMTLKVNQKDYIQAGVKDGDAWCEIPLCFDRNIVESIDDGIYQVNMKGMTSIVVLEDKATLYLNNKQTIKDEAMSLIKKYNLQNSEAVGVMFLEKLNDLLKINPIVWVRDINTLFYETACGSGTTATVIVKSYLQNADISMDILQPSSYVITVTIKHEKEAEFKAIISGKVLTDGIDRKVCVE